MQRLQFLAEERRDEQILGECLERYLSERTVLHLQFYFETLLLTGKTGELLAFIEKDDFAEKLIAQPDKKARAIYEQAYRACRDLNDREGAEKYRCLMEQFPEEG